ncbi:MAG: hypothetical protein HY002_02695 [Candidatus Rokubacteria bacterium]|nr:hypothetical protein [Candidatus Rokubacteria bacterium]
MEYLDPTDSVATPRRRAPRVPSLDGKVVVLLDISKPKGNFFLDRVEERLRAEARPKAVLRLTKPTFTKPAPEALRGEVLAAADAVIEALAD